jgi:hypothetical protein
MKDTEIVARYHGVNVLKSCGYFYPEVNTDIECKTIKEVKEWIERVWVFVIDGLKDLAKVMDVPENVLIGYFQNLRH